MELKIPRKTRKEGSQVQDLDLMTPDATFFKTGRWDPVGVSSEDKKSSRELTGPKNNLFQAQEQIQRKTIRPLIQLSRDLMTELQHKGNTCRK